MICTRRERTGNNNRGFDVPSCQFPRIADGEGIHASFSGKIWSQVGGSSSASAGAANPKHQTLALLAQHRQSSAVNTLGAQHVDVVKLCKLLRCKSLGGAKDHVSSIVNHDIKAPVLDHDTLYRCIHRFLRSNIQFDGTEINLILCRELLCGFDLWHISASSFAHAGVHDVSSLRQFVSGQLAEAARCSCDHDYLLHD